MWTLQNRPHLLLRCPIEESRKGKTRRGLAGSTNPYQPFRKRNHSCQKHYALSIHSFPLWERFPKSLATSRQLLRLGLPRRLRKPSFPWPPKASARPPAHPSSTPEDQSQVLSRPHLLDLAGPFHQLVPLGDRPPVATHLSPSATPLPHFRVPPKQRSFRPTGGRLFPAQKGK